MWCNLLFGIFSFFEAGSPSKQSDIDKVIREITSKPWTRQHSRYAMNLKGELLPYCRLVCEERASRGAAKLANTIEALKASQYDSLNVHDINRLATQAQPVKHDRMSLPTRAGVVQPAEILTGERRSQFLNMFQSIPLCDSPTPGYPAACHMIAEGEELKVYKRLLSCRMATLIPVDRAIRDTKGRIISAGLFSVPHKELSDRLICDRRPFNAIEGRLSWCCLPHGSQLIHLYVPPGFKVVGSGVRR